MAGRELDESKDDDDFQQLLARKIIAVSGGCSAGMPCAARQSRVRRMRLIGAAQVLQERIGGPVVVKRIETEESQPFGGFSQHHVDGESGRRWMRHELKMQYSNSSPNPFSCEEKGYEY